MGEEDEANAPVEKEPMTPAKARLFLANDRSNRMKLCSAEIAEALKRHGCQLVAVPYISDDGRIGARVQVVGEQ